MNFIIYKIQGDEGLTLIGRKAPMRGESVPSIVDGGYRNAATAAGKVTSALAVGDPDKMISGVADVITRSLFAGLTQSLDSQPGFILPDAFNLNALPPAN